MLQAQTLTCVDCQKPFEFGVEEQRFYAERGFRQPVRCANCRAARRAERNADLLRNLESPPSGMLSWNETWGHYGGAPAGPRAERPRRAGGSQSFPTVCTRCGKETLVPFHPRKGRPVYCRECFSVKRKR